MILKGEVVGITDYGVFVEFDNGYTGLLHISQISKSFIKDLNKYFKIGQCIYTKVLEVNEQQKQYTLSTMDVDYNTGEKFKFYKNGFYTLKKQLPIWVESKLEEYAKEVKN